MIRQKTRYIVKWNSIRRWCWKYKPVFSHWYKDLGDVTLILHTYLKWFTTVYVGRANSKI
jgi:hypothetical protein